jgi:putative component of membrane protein insertase Oxa1/YidC/SpoIIIJ protein YidD
MRPLPDCMHIRNLILTAITFYQRYLSPHKGFCCAYRVRTGRSSCSVLGFRAVRRYGVFTGLGVLKRRTYLCGVAHRRYSLPQSRIFHAQRGFCDVGCDFPCEIPSFDSGASLSDCSVCGDCGSCDWPSRNRKKQENEKYLYIPPKVSKRDSDRCS